MLNFYVKPKDVMEFIQRVDPASGAGKTTGDAWHQFLVTQTATDGSIDDLEKIWLRSEGASGETLADLWASHTSRSGFTTGNLGDRIRAFFEGTAGVTFALLLENGTSRFLLQDSSGVLLLQ